MVTAGAAGALFVIASLLKAGDHMVIMRPDYATNIGTRRAIGGAITHVDQRFEDGCRLDLAAISAAIRESLFA